MSLVPMLATLILLAFFAALYWIGKEEYDASRGEKLAWAVIALAVIALLVWTY